MPASSSPWHVLRTGLMSINATLALKPILSPTAVGLVMSGLSTAAKPWPFAPLDPAKGNPYGKPPLAGIVFDVDGTLCLPQNYMFKEMRDALGILKTTDILEHLEHLSRRSEATSKDAWEAIKKIERNAMAKQAPQPGLAELMKYLETRRVLKAIVTRNFDEPVNHLLRTFLEPVHNEEPANVSNESNEEEQSNRLCDGLRGFDPILTRAFKPAKPAPDPLIYIARQWGIPSEELCERMIMVGDSKDDVESGRSARAVTVVIGNEENKTVVGDWRIDKLDDLINLLDG